MGNQIAAEVQTMIEGPGFKSREGATIPSVIFKCRVRDDTIEGPNPFKWKNVTTDQLFKGKRVVLFALPGGLYHKT